MGRPHRIVVLGASGTGKTALVQQLLFGDYVVRSYPVSNPHGGNPTSVLSDWSVALDLACTMKELTPVHVHRHQGVHLSVSDVYEMCVKTERGFTERMQVYDTPGHVSAC